MPRRKNCRWIEHPPAYSGFKPKGVPAARLKTETLNLDEYEAVRLADYLGLEHLESARRMGISRSVFTRLLEAARKKVAASLVEGKTLEISGGEYHFRTQRFLCAECGATWSAAFDIKVAACPDCGSENIESLNRRFGGRGFCQRHGYGRKARGETVCQEETERDRQAPDQ